MKLLEDWKYKLLALVVAMSLWSAVNLGNRVPVTVTRYIEIRNGSSDLIYELQPKSVNLRVYVSEKLLYSRFLKEVKAYVDLSHIKEPGTYRLKVNAETGVPLLVHPASIDPSFIEVVARINRN